MQGSGDREEGPGHTCSWDPATLMPCFLFVSQMKEKPWFDVRDVAKKKNTPSPPPSESGVCLNTCQKSESATSKASFLYGDHGIRPLHPSKGTPMSPAEPGDTLETGGLDFPHWLHTILCQRTSHLTTGNKSFLGHRNLMRERRRKAGKHIWGLNWPRKGWDKSRDQLPL